MSWARCPPETPPEMHALDPAHLERSRARNLTVRRHGARGLCRTERCCRKRWVLRTGSPRACAAPSGCSYGLSPGASARGRACCPLSGPRVGGLLWSSGTPRACPLNPPSAPSQRPAGRIRTGNALADCRGMSLHGLPTAEGRSPSWLLAKPTPCDGGRLPFLPRAVCEWTGRRAARK